MKCDGHQVINFHHKASFHQYTGEAPNDFWDRLSVRLNGKPGNPREVLLVPSQDLCAAGLLRTRSNETIGLLNELSSSSQHHEQLGGFLTAPVIERQDI